jgi:hypothetical protein
MRCGAQVGKHVQRVISRTYTIGCKRTWIRDLSEQISFGMSALPPELLQLLTSLTNRAVMRKQQELRRASLNSRLRMRIDLSVDKCKGFVTQARTPL